MSDRTGIVYITQIHSDVVKVGYEASGEGKRERAHITNATCFNLLGRLLYAEYSDEQKIKQLLYMSGARYPKATNGKQGRELFIAGHDAIKLLVYVANNGIRTAERAAGFLQARLLKEVKLKNLKFDMQNPDIDPFFYRVKNGIVDYKFHNQWKKCTGYCKLWLPFTNAFWGELVPGEKSFQAETQGRDQPQCIECRFHPERFADDKTMDLF